MKKVGLALSLLSALAFGNVEVKDSGVFVGLDLQVMSNSSKYLVAASNTTVYHYDLSEKNLVPTLKVGYRYFTLRSYMSYYYEKEVYDPYSLDSHSLSANVEYFPRIYKDDDMNIFLLIGFGLGYLDTTMHSQNSTIMSNHNGLGLKLSDNFHQQNFNYGPNIGINMEIESGFSFELGYRYRDTDVIENVYDSSEENVQSIKNQIYFGLNYIF